MRAAQQGDAYELRPRWPPGTAASSPCLGPADLVVGPAGSVRVANGDPLLTRVSGGAARWEQ